MDKFHKGQLVIAKPMDVKEFKHYILYVAKNWSLLRMDGYVPEVEWLENLYEWASKELNPRHNIIGYVYEEEISAYHTSVTEHVIRIKELSSEYYWDVMDFTASLYVEEVRDVVKEILE